MRKYRIALTLVLLGTLFISGCYGTGDPKTDYARQRGRAVDVLNHHLEGDAIVGQARNCTREMLSMVELTVTLYTQGMPWDTRKTLVFYVPPGSIFEFVIPLPEGFADSISHCEIRAETI